MPKRRVIKRTKQKRKAPARFSKPIVSEEKTTRFIIRTSYSRPRTKKFDGVKVQMRDVTRRGKERAERIQYVVTATIGRRTFTRTSDANPPDVFDDERMKKQGRDRFFQALAAEINPKEFGTDKPAGFEDGVAFGRKKFPQAAKRITIREGFISYFRR
jgi:hypothetical protein